MTALKSLIFMAIAPGTVAGWLPLTLFSPPGARGSMPLGDFRYAGLALIFSGVLISFWCAWDFTFSGKGTPAPIDPPKKLVVRGLYKYVRNPMYVGVLSIVLGEAIWFESRVLLLYLAIVFLAFCAFVILYEEPVLRKKFGDSYASYCKTVPRWLPARTKLG